MGAEAGPAAPQVPSLVGGREWETYQRVTVEAFVRAALLGHQRGKRTVQLFSAFFDPGTFRSLRERGVELDEAVTTMAYAAARVLEHAGRPPAGRRKR